MNWDQKLVMKQVRFLGTQFEILLPFLENIRLECDLGVSVNRLLCKEGQAQNLGPSGRALLASADHISQEMESLTFLPMVGHSCN